MTVRPPAVAGLFYPAEPSRLRDRVQQCLADAPAAGGRATRLLIAPHAGYDYSGAVAGRAYASIAASSAGVSRVAMLGPAHRVPVHGMAVPTVDAFRTPLGAVPLDRDALRSLRELPQVVADDRPHALEHALEVQLPFLQVLLGEFALVPLVVGDAGEAEVAAVLERLWSDEEALVVVSSDLSHYLPYETARVRDRATVERILALQPVGPDDACGAAPINGALVLARGRGLVPRLLDLRNSGDTAGDRHRVVGYAALAFEEGA